MKEIIKELWYGNLNPSEELFLKTAKEKGEYKKFQECTEKFEAMLSKELLELFEKREDLAAGVRSMIESKIFINGFCLGAKTVIEVYQNNKSDNA
ncbi:MAG: hypothetical protein J6B71_08850 [Clostridia bacterium]|nr:hypothetical protein [Clostridia bacterium]